MKSSTVLKKVLCICLTVICLQIIMATATMAASSGMPWETPLQKILDSISGPVAKVIGVIAIVATGLGLAFGEAGGGMKKMVQIVFGLSIAFSATSFFLGFLGFSSGLPF